MVEACSAENRCRLVGADNHSVGALTFTGHDGLGGDGPPPHQGKRVTDRSLASGAFYRPSLIEVVDLNAPIIQQEIFGPVATFEVFNDEHDAIHRANATEFGLAAGVFTRDVDHARRVSR